MSAHTIPNDNPQNFLLRFLKLESAGGILLIIAAGIAMIMANSPLKGYYNLLLGTPVEVSVGSFVIDKPLLLWINDGLMAIFFFLVGLELKRELLEGELAKPGAIALPVVGAIGGMAVPALVYWFFNRNDPVGVEGWAIPAATDIAFALGILSLLGRRVPLSVKVFLTSLAIFDDLGAIIIIALFYTSKISTLALLVVAFCVPILYVLNRNNVGNKSIYIFLGIIMWASMLKSGVHATLTGVLLAMFIPLRIGDYSPLKRMEHDLHSAVAFFILPVFAFANSGISFLGMGISNITHSVPVGVAAGLFIGKQLGVFTICWAAIKAGWLKLPEGMSWMGLYGVSALCGVGFTMSLFIGSLAFDESRVGVFFDERLGIIIGSLASGILGYLILSRAYRQEQPSDPA